MKTASDQIGVDLSSDPMAKDRIAERARVAVEGLRSSASCGIDLPFLTADRTGPKHFSCSLTRSQVDELLGSDPLGLLFYAFFLIADIDSPRRGVIRVDPQNLLSLAASLR